MDTPNEKHDNAVTQWIAKPTWDTPKIIEIISTKFGLTREQLVNTEVVETAILKRAISIDPEFAKQITPEDVACVTGNASWFSGDYISLPEYLVVDYRSLSFAQRNALCKTYMKHYTLTANVFTLEAFERQAASYGLIYMSGHIRRANHNNIVFFPMYDFLTKILDTLLL